MILTWADESTYYMVDEDGNVYTANHYSSREIYLRSGRSPQPGERPDTSRHQQVGGGHPYWLPTGQTEAHRMTDEIREALAEARARRDDLIAGMDDVVAELDYHEGAIAELLERIDRPATPLNSDAVVI